MKYICQLTKHEFDDDETDPYEYRGFVFCEPHFDEGIAKVDQRRQEVIDVTKHSVYSQRVGEFVNNRKKYHTGNVASDGLPVIHPYEPQILRDFEAGEL